MEEKQGSPFVMDRLNSKLSRQIFRLSLILYIIQFPGSLVLKYLWYTAKISPIYTWNGRNYTSLVLKMEIWACYLLVSGTLFP